MRSMTDHDLTEAPEHRGSADHSDLHNHPGVTRVREALAAHDVEAEVRYLPSAVRTARAAADAIGVTPAEIANSLVFRGVEADGTVAPLLIMASGGHRVDVTKVARLAGLRAVTRADPDFVREETGFIIGGVAPVGHLHPIRTVVDRDLDRFEAVWAAAGHSHAVFRTSYTELVRLTGGTPMDVA